MYQEIDFTPTFNKLREVFILYNEKLKLIKPQQYRKLSLKSTHMETARELIRWYGAYLHKNKVKQLDPERRFWITNSGVAKKKLQNRCTIYRHILILQQSGVITNKIFHGSSCGVEIEINKGLLVYKKLKGDSIARIQAELFRCEAEQIKQGDGLKTDIVARLSNNDSRDPIETLNKNMKSGFVDNENKPETFDWKQGNKSSGTGNTQLIESGQVKQETRVAGGDPAFSEFIDYFTHRAWGFAKSVLYKNKEFTMAQEEQTWKYIREYFSLIRHELFTRPFAERIFKDFCERILLAKKFVDKSPQRFIPFPWIYFDKHFEGGFAGTLRWLKAVKQKRERQKGYYSNLSFLVNQYQRFMHEPTLVNYRLGEKEIAKKKDLRLMEIYQNCVADRQNFSPAFLHTYYQHNEHV